LIETFSGLDLPGQQGFEYSIDWVICGGESGHNARPMHPDWARSLRDQCKSAGVAFFFKQWGEYIDTETMVASHIQSAPTKGCLVYEQDANTRSHMAFKIGKKAAGSLLDGIEYKEFPNG
jgi:hypothetical protein